MVFDALDGKGTASQVNGSGPRTNINYRDAPVAFFMVLFGIVIEALVTRPGDDESRDILKILSALKRILLPSVAGNAIFQDSVFAETLEIFDRLALTEGLAVQTVLVDIAKTLSITHPSAGGENTATDLTEDVDQLFALAKIIMLVMTNALPNIAEAKAAPRDTLADDAVALIRSGFEALVDISTIFPSIIKTDLYASILHIFSTVLRTPACQASVVAQVLPIFRRFILKICTDGPRAHSSTIAPQVTTCLHQLLAILGIAQRREHESSLVCARNTLLAISVLLSTASDALGADEALVFAALEATLDCVQDLGLAKVAAGCLRSLLLTSPKKATDEAVARCLFPRLIVFVVDPDEPDPEDSRALIASALTGFVALYADEGEKAAAAMSLVLPALLRRAKGGGRKIYGDTAARIVELATG
ncbi:MAG: hypothetical protein Q9197_005873, partial [Variospora fuerteventurae]